MEEALKTSSRQLELAKLPIKAVLSTLVLVAVLALIGNQILRWEQSQWQARFESAALARLTSIEAKLKQLESDLLLLQSRPKHRQRALIDRHLKNEPAIYRIVELRKFNSKEFSNVKSATNAPEFGHLQQGVWQPVNAIESPIWSIIHVYGGENSVVPQGLSFQWPDLSNQKKHAEVIEFPYAGGLLITSVVGLHDTHALGFVIDIQNLAIDGMTKSMADLPGVILNITSTPPKNLYNTIIKPTQILGSPVWLQSHPDHKLLHLKTGRMTLIFALLSILTVYVFYRRLMERHASSLNIEKRVTERTKDLSEANRALIQDALERGKAISALRESEARYQALTDNAHDIITRLTPSGKRISVSSSVYKVLGYSPDQLADFTPFDYAHPEDQQIIRKAHERIIRRGASGKFICRMQHKQGHWVWLETNATAIHDVETGKIREIHAVSRDISNTMDTERQLQENQSLLQTAFEDAAIAMAVSTEDGKFERINPSFCKLTGYSTHELSQLAFTDIVHPADQNDLAAQMDQAKAQNLPSISTELRCLNKQGEVTWVRFNGMFSRARDEDQTNHMVVQLVDIHHFKAKQAQLHDKQQEFVALMQGISDAVVVIDDYGFIQNHNRRFRALCAATKNDLDSKSADALLMLPDEQGNWRDLGADYLSELKTAIPTSIRIKTRNGDIIERNLKVQMVPHEDQHDRCLFIIRNS